LSQPPVGRGGLKLEAAFDRFPLDVRGARAIDVGASTGGFTEALLAHGAAQVTAVDVGRGQLHAKLRDDPRVINLEGVDWKKLSLDVAPGPFDFFSVDVSFVAARSMLRGLAFRLRDGAEGVVLVKPQFELPDQKVKGGNVTDPNLRRLALEKVREKAESLGFELLRSDDSPVAGGSGTVEILAHFRFRGRSQKLPKPGESRGQPKRPPRQIAAPLQRYFAVAAPGLEPFVESELRALGLPEIARVDGGVEFGGEAEAIWRANLWLRTATRVLARVGELDAREFSRLRRGAGTLPWERFLPEGASVEISASASRCRLYHTGAIAENLEQAVADRVGKPKPEASAPLKILARGVGDHWTFSVDTSGELLHRRGWRAETAEAPLRETLGAALLLACEWNPATPLYDPMCGAGTLLVEGCALAMNLAPGLGRAFAFERWPAFDAARFAELREAARTAARSAPSARIAGSDHSPSTVEAARRNIERAGLSAHIAVAVADLDQVRAPEGAGLVLTNAPYGKRVGDPRALRPLYGKLGRLLRGPFRAWHAGVLLADARLIGAMGLKAKETRPLQNGGLKVQLARFSPRG
jgi:putative N6-adenine-specific DNA methylase